MLSEEEKAIILKLLKEEEARRQERADGINNERALYIEYINEVKQIQNIINKINEINKSKLIKFLSKVIQFHIDDDININKQQIENLASHIIKELYGDLCEQ